MKKACKITLIVISIVIALLISIIVFLGQATFTFVKLTEPNANYNSVLKSVYNQNNDFGNVPINKIALLGAHDSLSYDINYHSMPNSSEDTASNNKFLYNVGRGFIVRLSRAQAHDVYAQLNAGVRYVDARITNIDGTFYTSHGLVSGLLEKSLLQILKFLDENPGEYIIFHIVHFYKGNSGWEELNNYISGVRYQNKNLFDYVNYDLERVKSFSSLTYNDMTDGGTKSGVLFLGEDRESGYGNYYKLSNINSVWHNTIDSGEIVEKISENYEKLKAYETDALCINQTQTTPNYGNIFKTVFSWSLIDKAAKHNEIIINNQSFKLWLSKMPIYLCDYSTSNVGDFNNKANTAIMQFNLSLA